MSQERKVTRGVLRTPWAAAIAGIAFSVLMLIILGLYWASVPADPLQRGPRLADSGWPLSLALGLVPFAGIAFLWFIGVLRDRLGDLEDHFFATVFLGSGLLFLSMLFVAAAVIGALVLAYSAEPALSLDPTTATFARALAYNVVNVYAVKTAAVFMFTTSTIALYTGIAPRWIALLGFVLALILLLGSYYIRWSSAVLPLWILLISIHILIDNFHRRYQPIAGAAHGSS